MIRKLSLIVISLLTPLLFIGCATTGTNQTNVTQADIAQTNTSDFNSTGTLSPLNTKENPWTNVSPQVQAQQQAARAAAAGHGGGGRR